MFRLRCVCLIMICISCKENTLHFEYSKPPINKTNNTSRSIFVKNSCPLEKQFVAKGLININSLDTSIKVSLHYSTSHNFLKKPIYNGLQDCYLPCEVAIKLSNAQYFLKQQFPYYNIIVFDATRPLSAQTQMWNDFDMPAKDKINYLAHPHDISLHNYGAAVDVGIISNEDVLLNMGTDFDTFEELSKPAKEKQFYWEGKLSKNALANRLLLRQVMYKAGFTGITSEWWHFNATTKLNAASRYSLIE
jgi:D-alanyl-D-alanine dipeptidase